MLSKEEIEKKFARLKFIGIEAVEAFFTQEINRGNADVELVKGVFNELTNKDKKYKYVVRKKRNKKNTYEAKVFTKKHPLILH